MFYNMKILGQNAIYFTFITFFVYYSNIKMFFISTIIQ